MISKNKIALVTGGASRIGREICLALSAMHYDVLIHFRQSSEQAEKTRLECLAAGASQAKTISCDFDLIGERAKFIGEAIGVFGRIDLLVNNASMFEYDDAKTFTEAKFHEHLQSNYLAPLEFTMELFRLLNGLKKERAHVVTVLDQKVFNLNTDYMTYTLSKLAGHSSIRYLAQCCAPTLRVNAVAPGITLASSDMSENIFEKAHKYAALDSSSTPQDIAAAIIMLDSAPAITGQTIAVDGGQHLLPRARDVAFEE